MPRAARNVPAATMLAEVMLSARPGPGDIAVDCTIGGGGHALALLERLRPGGRLIGIDLDAAELARTNARVSDAGFGPDVFIARHASFADLPSVLAGEGVGGADLIVADLGVSAMQIEAPDRGFSYKGVGPLDMRMDPSRGEPASALLARASAAELAGLLDEYGDEPHARLIADLLADARPATTHGAERVVRVGLNSARPDLTRADVKMSIRRTFQALRIAVNDEIGALDALLQALPSCLRPGGRAVILTFHSGEDRRVKKAFQAGARRGVYREIARRVIRPSAGEIRANRRVSSAKLRWAIR